jgi:cell division septum initiation protein DivIVA
MSPHHDHQVETPTVGTPSRKRRRFGRQLLGYRRATVEAWGDALDRYIEELRHEVADSTDQIVHLTDELGALRARIRFHEDREQLVRSEMERVARDSDRMLHEARMRGEEVERAAQERALRMVDRVCDEANQILQHARDEARELLARNDAELARARQRVSQMADLQRGIRSSMRTAVEQFEQGMHHLETPHTTEAAIIGDSIPAPEPSPPIGRLVPIEAPKARVQPTFGRDKAIAAANAASAGTDAASPQSSHAEMTLAMLAGTGLDSE